MCILQTPRQQWVNVLYLWIIVQMWYDRYMSNSLTFKIVMVVIKWLTLDKDKVIFWKSLENWLSNQQKSNFHFRPFVTVGQTNVRILHSCAKIVILYNDNSEMIAMRCVCTLMTIIGQCIVDLWSGYRSKHDKCTQCWHNAGPASQTFGQHCTNVGTTFLYQRWYDIFWAGSPATPQNTGNKLIFLYYSFLFLWWLLKSVSKFLH